MGCTPSKPDAPDDLSGLFGPPRPIPVDIGAAIKHHLQKNTNSIVFIFGGPASQKGLIIEELTSSFNFMSISVEDIVFQYLPSRLSGTGTAIKEIQEALRNDEGMLSIDWILEMIAGRMSLAMNQRFVIDIVPAVASILKSEEYRARTHDRQLSQFEQKHPISFAIDVNVLDEQNLMRSNGETPANGRDDDSKRINPELNQMMKGADDIDRGKMEKRISEYHTCAEPFLQYFRKSNRVVKMSLSSEAVNNLVNTTRETLLKLGFTIARKDDRIICFTTCDTPETSPENIDLAYYKLKVINVNEIAKASDNLTAKICAVHRYISSHNRHDDNFLVVIPNVNVQYSEKMKRINFLEKKGLVYLDEFIKNKQHDKPPKFRTRIPVNCISSSRQQFLFFESFPNDVAKAISLLYLKQKEASNPSNS